MIVDSSALVAIVFKEPGFETLVDVLTQSSAVGASTPTLLETGIVLTARLRRNAGTFVRRLMQELEIQPVPFGELHWETALDAFARYGKGRHPAGLNFGDCMSYATAQLAQQPLLYVGDDFSKTDVRRAELLDRR